MEGFLFILQNSSFILFECIVCYILLEVPYRKKIEYIVEFITSMNYLDSDAETP